MSVIKNDDNIKPKNMRNKAPVYEIPAVIRKEKEELLIAKQTVETILNIDKKKVQEQEKKSVR